MNLNLEKSSKINICFIGHMGSGKSILGKQFAKLLAFKFYDSDKLVEKKLGKSINEIFLSHGEDYFRKIEEEVVLKLLKEKNCVISLGGGSILSKLIRKAIEKKSITIYLKVKINVLCERLKNSKKRPLLKDVDIKNKILELNRKRIKYYENANLIIDNSQNSTKTIFKIKQYLSNYND
tara:strand:+ start:214 stop:750 length:537 start_codon:yes stop_codon:yes gene_type:complete